MSDEALDVQRHHLHADRERDSRTTTHAELAEPMTSFELRVCGLDSRADLVPALELGRLLLEAPLGHRHAFSPERQHALIAASIYRALRSQLAARALLHREHRQLDQLPSARLVGDGRVPHRAGADRNGPDGNSIRLRRIELHLHKPTRDGETIVGILTNLPEGVTAVEVADLYRRRWTIESMFQKLESVLASEIKTLGYPRAALFSFCVAILAYNVLSMLQAAVEAEHGIQPRSHAELSLYFVAEEVKATHAGMMIAVPADQWTPLRDLSLLDYCKLLLRIAAKVDPAALRKTVRGPKQRVKKKPVPPSVAGAHVSTARLLDKRNRRP